MDGAQKRSSGYETGDSNNWLVGGVKRNSALRHPLIIILGVCKILCAVYGGLVTSVRKGNRKYMMQV